MVLKINIKTLKYLAHNDCEENINQDYYYEK